MPLWKEDEKKSLLKQNVVYFLSFYLNFVWVSLFCRWRMLCVNLLEEFGERAQKNIWK